MVLASGTSSCAAAAVTAVKRLSSSSSLRCGLTFPFYGSCFAAPSVSSSPFKGSGSLRHLSTSVSFSVLSSSSPLFPSQFSPQQQTVWNKRTTPTTTPSFSTGVVPTSPWLELGGGHSRSRAFGGVRFFSSNERPTSSDSKREDEKTTENETTTTSSSSSLTDNNNKLPPVLQNSLTGVGQVIFLNSQTCGAVLLGSLAIADPYLATLALTGSLTSTATANVTKLNTTATSNGLLSYNGCLVGCATAVFIAPAGAPLMGLATTVAGASAATAVTASLGNTFTKMPQWTYAFNIVTLTMLFRSQPFLKPAEAAAVPESTTMVVEAAAAVTETVANTTPSLTSLALSPFTGLSQIFVVESALSGLGITAAIALYSPLLAGHAVLGSAVGSLTGAMLLLMGDGAAPTSASDITSGLWGFNSALTSMGIGVFFQNTRHAWMLSAAGAMGTAAVFGAMAPVFGDVFHSPCLTLPFCLTMSACYHLAGVVPGLELAKGPHSPEKNNNN